MNLVHLSNHSVNISTIQLIQWDVDMVTSDNERLRGVRVFTTAQNFFLHVEDPNYIEDVAKLKEAVGKYL